MQLNEAPRGKPRGIKAEFFRSPNPPSPPAGGFGGFSSPCLLRRSSRFGCEGRASPQQAAGYSAKENKPKLIIGLGNPDLPASRQGKKYANTYHNIGFLAVDYLAKNPQISNFKFLISKSTEYMNNSGKFVVKELKKCGVKPEELLIVHDDSDIELGKYKLSFGRGAAGHHGVESVQTALKTKNFWRLRIGIRPKTQKLRRVKAGEFVLKKISKTDKALLEKTFEEILKTL